jgi:hypothetical protein
MGGGGTTAGSLRDREREIGLTDSSKGFTCVIYRLPYFAGIEGNGQVDEGAAREIL